MPGLEAVASIAARRASFLFDFFIVLILKFTEQYRPFYFRTIAISILAKEL